MISRFARLLKELRLRHRRDTVARLRQSFELKTGLLRKRYAAAPSPWTSVAESEISAADLSVFSSVAIAVFVDEPDVGHDAVCSDAAEIAAGRYRIFGRDVCVSPEKVNWHESIEREGSWPIEHWTQIPFKSLSALGDIKYAWELARQQMLLPLAAGFLVEGKSEYSQHIRETMVRFWNDNPREMGVHFISNMEIGIRSLVWLWCFAACEESEAFDVEFQTRLARELFLNGRHIAEKIQFTADTGRNNHLIGDAASLQVISQVFPQSAEAQVWKRKSAEILGQCLREQFLSSGMHFERSFGYQCFVLEFLWCVYLANGTEPALKEPLLQQIQESTDLLIRFATPTGDLPAINDDDDGYVFFPKRSRSAQREWLVKLRDRHFRDGRRCHRGGSDDDFDYFHHETGCAVFVDHHGDPFPDSGHNHASLLQVLFWLDGEPVLVDSGTYGYNGTGPLRNQFRGTSCHNALTLDGRGQAEPSRGFGWLSLANPASFSSDMSASAFSFFGEHRCFDSAVHARHVYWNQHHRVLAIRDSLACRDDRVARQFWHLSPKLDLQEDAKSVLVTGENVELRAHFPTPDSSIGVHRDRKKFPECAYSPAYGVIEDKPVICQSWQTDGEARWAVFCSDAFLTVATTSKDVLQSDSWQIAFEAKTNSIRFTER